METNIQIFTSDIFGEIRTCQVNNQIMFVGKDVATALGYSNTRDALSKHVDAEDKLESQIATSGQRRAIILINESGLSIVYWQSGEKATRGRALTFLTKKH